MIYSWFCRVYCIISNLFIFSCGLHCFHIFWKNCIDKIYFYHKVYFFHYVFWPFKNNSTWFILYFYCVNILHVFLYLHCVRILSVFLFSLRKNSIIFSLHFVKIRKRYYIRSLYTYTFSFRHYTYTPNSMNILWYYPLFW